MFHNDPLLNQLLTYNIRVEMGFISNVLLFYQININYPLRGICEVYTEDIALSCALRVDLLTPSFTSTSCELCW